MTGAGEPACPLSSPRHLPRCLANFEQCSIWIMRSDGTHRQLVIPFLTTPTETNNFDPKVSPDGGQITLTRFGYHGVISQVWAARIDGTHAHPVTAARLEAGQPEWQRLEELESAESTAWWRRDAAERAASGEEPGSGEGGPGLDEAAFRRRFGHLFPDIGAA